MGCRHSTPQTRGGAAPRSKLVHVRAAPRAVRDSASSLEAGQHLGRASGSPEWKRLGSGENKNAEEDEDGKKETPDETSSFAARPSTANPPSASRGSAIPVTLKRGVAVAPVTDPFESRADRQGDPMKHPIARATDASPPRTKNASPTRRKINGAASADGATRGTLGLPLRGEFLDDDVDDDDVSSPSSSSSSATSVLLMSTFDGTVSRKETRKEASPASASSDETSSLDALLRETRALLNRTAPGRFGDARGISLRESILGADDAGDVPFEEDFSAKGASRAVSKLVSKTNRSERVPVLEAYDEDLFDFARMKHTRGARRLEYSTSRPNVETRLTEDPTRSGARIRASARANETRGERRFDRPDGKKATTETEKKKSHTFDSSRRKSLAQTQTLQDGATRRRLASAKATLARVEAYGQRVRSRDKVSAAHPARASVPSASSPSRARADADASADRARRLGDVLAEFRARGEKSAETFPDENQPLPSAIGDTDADVDENAARDARTETSVSLSSSPFSRRARFFAGLAPDAPIDARLLKTRSMTAKVPSRDAFASPTVRATPLTSGAPARAVAPMSEKMRRARSALRALQIPGAEPPAPRRARVAAQAERVSSASTFVTATTQRGSAHNAAACAARPASHLGGNRDRYG